MARETKKAAPKAAKKFKLPKTLAQCADLYFNVREERLKAVKALEPLKDQETALKTHLIDNVPKSQASGIAGKVARVTVVTKDVAQVKDWDKLYKWIKKTGNFQVLGRAISAEAVEEITEKTGKPIPGIGTFKVVSLSLNKV
ncbi:MAG: hypothetical protein V4498_00590 [candidate division FCPU426 bacterium]